MNSADSIIAGLGGVVKPGKCVCPACGGKKLSVTQRGDKVLVKCWARCSQDAVISALRDKGLWGEKRADRTDKSDTQAKARALLRAASKSKETPADYLKGRGIDLVPNNLKLVDKAAMREITGHRFPAVVASITGSKGDAAQATFLTLDGTQNAVCGDGKKLRRTFGPSAGGYVELGEIDGDKPLPIAEGIETCLAFMEIMDLPGGAASIGTSGMQNIKPPAASEYILGADHDENGAGMAAAKALASRLAASGAVVRIAMPDKPGTDWNDKIRVGVDAAELKRRIMKTKPFKLDPTEMRNARIDALAALSLLDYELQRETAAKELGVRVLFLDEEVKKRRVEFEDEASDNTFLAEVEPWPKPVDGADLLDEIADVVDKHIVLPKFGPEAVALWCVHCHAHDAARHSPILFITSPTKRCGKSNLLDVLYKVVPKPLPAANVTPATVFRVIDRWKPTLLIDETDTFISDKSELRGVLNAGHNRAAPFVLRCVGDDHEPKQFSVWAPKAFAAIGRLPDTLEDRSVKIELKRKLKGDKVERIPGRADVYHNLRRKAARWVEDNFDALAEAEPPVPEALSDRQRDNWSPLLAIADIAGGDWSDLARDAARKLAVIDDDEGIGEKLLADIAKIFDEEGDRLHSSEIVEELIRVEGAPWAEFYRGQPITQNRLARLLKPFKIFPRNVRIDDVTRSGYTRDRFESAFKRYVEGYATHKALKRKTNQGVKGRATHKSRAGFLKG